MKKSLKNILRRNKRRTNVWINNRDLKVLDRTDKKTNERERDDRNTT